jgi:hypothetical protein
MTAITEQTYRDRRRQVLEWIKANPQHWDQSDWHCQTSHCVAGVAEMFSLNLDPVNPHDCETVIYGRSKLGQEISTSLQAREWMGLSQAQADTLFDADNSLGNIEELFGCIDPIPDSFEDLPTYLVEFIATYPGLTQEQLDRLVKDEDWRVRVVVAAHPNLTASNINLLIVDEDADVREAIAAHVPPARACREGLWPFSDRPK